MLPQEISAFLRKLPHEDYLLHGSIEGEGGPYGVLRPYTPPGRPPRSEWRQCAVYATPVIEVALIRALARTEPGMIRWYIPHEWYKHKRGIPPFIVEGRNLKLGPGYIYIVPRLSFRQLPNSWHFASRKPVTPIAVMPVTPTFWKQEYPHIKFHSLT